MSIATIVLRGFGTSSYADVLKLPTLGYTSLAAAPSLGTPERTFAAMNRGQVFAAKFRGQIFTGRK